jgi:hypothetical protein
MDDFLPEITKLFKDLEGLDAKVIIVNDKQVGTLKEKMGPSLSDRLERSQTNEQALEYAELEKFKQGEIPDNNEEHEKMLDLQTKEIVDKYLKDI